VGAAESLQQQENVTTSKGVIRNPYGRRGKPKVNTGKESEDYDDNSELEVNHVEVIEPHDIKDALASPQAAKWRRAIKDELESLESRGTWEVAKPPQDKRCIGCRWIFKIKRL